MTDGFEDEIYTGNQAAHDAMKQIERERLIHNAKYILKLAGIGLIVVVVAAVFILSMQAYYKEYNVVAKVTDKNVLTKKTGDTVDYFYGIYTNNGTLKIDDAPLKGSMMGSDLYGRIEIGKTYNFTVYGYRSGWQSEYPNIIAFEEVKA